MKSDGAMRYSGPAIWICGPTAVGKTSLAIDLAGHLNGEVVSVDSMQVYQGMDIGTGKPTLAERRGVPHHLMDVVQLPETFDAARFVSLARESEESIRTLGKIPIFCGGTGLYFKAYEEGLGDAPPSDPVVRAQIELLTPEEIGNEIEKKDPELWRSIDRKNPRRLIRALEVIRLTGRPFSEQRSKKKTAVGSNKPGVLKIGVSRERDDLRSRIASRVEAMFQAGLVEETRALCQKGLRECSTARQALGYRQVLLLLEGALALNHAVQETVLRTQQFAKRQMTWFRGQCELNWLIWEESLDVQEMTARVLDLWRGMGGQDAK